jgi:hypothetical protein
VRAGLLWTRFRADPSVADALRRDQDRIIEGSIPCRCWRAKGTVRPPQLDLIKRCHHTTHRVCTHRRERAVQVEHFAVPGIARHERQIPKPADIDLEFGSRVAQQNSHAEIEADLHPLRHVPRWEWPATADRGNE